MKDNPCPNTFLLLLTGEMRMKEKVMLLLLLCWDQSKTELQTAVFAHSLQPQGSISNITALPLSAQWTNLAAAQFY